MSEKYDNLRRDRDLENWNQRRFEQEVAEEIGTSRRSEGERGTKGAGQTGTTRTTGTTGTTGTQRRFGSEPERGESPTRGSQERPRC